MTAPATEKTALEYLAAADHERAAGNHHQAAALMWQATQATFAALADAHGVKYQSLDEDALIDVAKALEKGASEQKRAWRYSGGLISCALLKDHAELDVLERLPTGACL